MLGRDMRALRYLSVQCSVFANGNKRLERRYTWGVWRETLQRNCKLTEKLLSLAYLYTFALRGPV